MMHMTFRPIQWEGPQTTARRSIYQFKAAWSSTLVLLDHELRQLDADNVVLQADFAEADIRLDGMVRANARQPRFPGVRLLFDSRHGQLAYATDAYDGWRENVRAIALSLEALRKVDRYGVSSHAEQYKGWRAIESGPSVDGRPVVRAMLARLINERAGRPTAGVYQRPGLDNGWNLTDQELYREAVKVAHPDAGGSREAWDGVQAAKTVLGL